MKVGYILRALLSCILLSGIGCGKSEDRPYTVIVFHAGSLTMPMMKIEEEFEKQYSDIDIQREASGSRNCARKVTDLKKSCDIIVSADYTVIDSMLIPEYSDWNIRFASNRMVIAYTKKSRYADSVNENNWFDIFRKPDVIWGHADPDIDPCGYRALMAMQLSEIYYKKPGLYRNLMAVRKKEFIRPKSVELISLLQSANMDYAWEYRSVAAQHKLRFIELSDRINMGNEKFQDFYARAFVELSGEKPGTKIIQIGDAIVYGVTMLKNAPQRDKALLFLKYLLDINGGLEILNGMGQPAIVPPVTAECGYRHIPEELKTSVRSSSLLK